jgi:hypothetical protein
MRFCIAAAALIAIGATLRAQPPVPVPLALGDARIEVHRLQPYRVRWKETIVNAVHQVIERGTWDDALTRERLDNRDVLVRSILITQPDGAMREKYRTVVDAATFAPVHAEWQNGLGLSYRYAYTLPLITGERVNTKGAAPVAISARAPRPAFDYYGGMMELFLATLPRTPGGTFTFPALLATSGHDADQSGVDWPRVEVFAEETARGAGGSAVRATRMEANTKYGFYKVWVTSTPPYVVRTVLLLAPGGRITYELLEPPPAMH